MKDSVRVAVRRWNVWLPGIQGETEAVQWAAGGRLPEEESLPDVTQVPAMLRRRLGPVGKPVAGVAWDLMNTDDPDQSLVFASRHGDQSKTLQLLAEVGACSPLSPAAFSLSVHNAVAGLLSIAKGATGPHTALAADQRLLAAAITEAYGQLIAGAASVVCVVYDLPLPSDYRFEENQALPYALALELTLQDGQPLALDWTPEPGARPKEPEALSWLRWWAQGGQGRLALQDTVGSWQWQRC